MKRLILSAVASAGLLAFGEEAPAWQVEGILPRFREKAPECDSAARWVWCSGAASKDQVCALRCSFVVTDEVEKVSFYGYADDSAKYWVNGTSVRRNEGGDVKSSVVIGENVFAIVASNATGKAGSLVRCDLGLKNGGHVSVTTSAAMFKAAEGDPAGAWRSPGFDDSAWSAATEIGDVWYEYWARDYDYSRYCATAEERETHAAKVAAAAEAKARREAELAAEPAPDAKIVYTNGMPKISLNGTLVDPVFNQSGVDNAFRLNAVAKMASLGVKIHQLTLRPAEYEKSAGTYDFGFFEEKVNSLLEADPDARILMLVRMEFTKWIAAHPEERVEYAKGVVVNDGDDRTDRVIRPSPASFAYRAEVRRFLSLLGEYIASRPWGKRVVGVRPSWGVYTEWHMYGMDQGPDVGPAMTAAFHRWKGGLYDGQSLPTMAERTDTSDPFFIDVESHRKVIDYYECMANEISDLLTNVAASAKAAFPGRLVGMYYGYVMATHSPEGANVMLDKALACEDIDFLSNPADYTEDARLAGGAYCHRTIPATFHRYGKLAMLEDDMRHYHVYDYMNLKYICTRSEREEEMTMRRNWINQYFDGCGIQFLDPEDGIDIRPFTMDTPPVWRAINDSKRVLSELGARADDSGNEVAVVVDWRGRLRRATQEVYAFELVYMYSLPGLYATGVPFDLMTLDDYLAKPVDRYRKVVFLNVVAPDAELKTALESRVTAADVKSVWLVNCPFSLDPSSAKVRRTDNLPLGGEAWRGILVDDLGATPIAPTGHCVRRHGDAVMFHTGSAGSFALELPGCAGATELYSGTRYEGGSITVETSGPDTRCFRLERASAIEIGEISARPRTDYNGNAVSVPFSGSVPEGAVVSAKLTLAGAEYVGTVEGGVCGFVIPEDVVTIGNTYDGTVSLAVDDVVYTKPVTLRQGKFKVDENAEWIRESASGLDATGKWSGDKVAVEDGEIAVEDVVFTAANPSPADSVVTVASTFRFGGANASDFAADALAGVKVVKAGGKKRYAFLTGQGVVTNLTVPASVTSPVAVTTKVDLVGNELTYTVGADSFGPFPLKPGATVVSGVKIAGESSVDSLDGSFHYEGIDTNLASAAGVEYATVADAVAAGKGDVELLWDTTWEPSAAGDFTFTKNGFTLAIGGPLAYSVKDNGDGTVTVTVAGGSEDPAAPTSTSITLAGDTVKVGVKDIDANCWYALATTSDLTKEFVVDATTWTKGSELLAGTSELSIALAVGEAQAFYRVVVSTTAP